MGVECREVYLCPRCRAEMEVYVESERLSERRGASRFLRCPACSLRIQLESYQVHDLEDEVTIVFTRKQPSRKPVKTLMCYST